jgi:CheY-like chemotaxis protein
VLFVSGDAELRTMVTTALETGGYFVTAVAHSGHALLRCRTNRYDVLIAELSSPDMSGPMLAEFARRHCPGLPALYIGQPSTPETVEMLLVRPFGRSDVVQRVDALLRPIAAPAPAQA